MHKNVPRIRGQHLKIPNSPPKFTWCASDSIQPHHSGY